MAYAKKYTTTFATQSGDDITVELWENDYVGSVIDYRCDLFNLQYIPSGDDPFEPIYASQIEVVIDVTDNASNMPDFTTLNDRKYHTKVIQSGNLIWQGWTLSDDVNYLFSTGSKKIKFNAICGLGMLKDIDFLTTSTDLRNPILFYLCEALKKVAFPSNPTILSSCGIYSSSMDNTIEPWEQAYMSFTNFINVTLEENRTVRNRFDCLRVLSDILLSWGCRIFMANGEWNIVQVNQMWDSSRAWVRFDADGTTVTSGTFTTVKNVPLDAIFIGGDQNKIYKKGFNNFLSEKTIEYADNSIFNADLKLYSGDDATLWTRSTSGTGAVFLQNNADKDINGWILTLGDVTAGALAQVESNSPIPVTYGDSPKVQFRVYKTLQLTDGGGTLLPNVLMKLIVVGGAGSVYLRDDNTWQTLEITGNDYYKVNDKTDDSLVNLEEIPPVPGNGLMYFSLFLQGSVTNTQPILICGDFEITTRDALLKKITMTAKINDADTYRKKIEFPHGYNSDYGLFGINASFLGGITDIDGNPLEGWYMKSRYTIDSFPSLAHCMFNNYINMFCKNIINIDGTIEGVTTALDVYTFDDTDPSQINVGSKKYIIGNSTFMPIPNELQCTFLEVSNDPQEITITTKYDNGVDPGISFSMAGAAVNKPGACALVTYTLTKYADTFLPTVGDTIYNEAKLTTTFAGGGIWWKLYSRYYNTVRALRISSAGVVLESQTC